MKRVYVICGLYLIGLIIGLIAGTERFLSQENAVLTWICVAQMIWSGPAILWVIRQINEEGMINTKVEYNPGAAAIVCIFIVVFAFMINFVLAYGAVNALQRGTEDVAARLFLLHSGIQILPILVIFTLDRIANKFCSNTI